MGSLKNIYRDERAGFYGWVVKIKRLKKTHIKYFNDGPDQPTESLAKAIAYRDRLIQRLPPPTKRWTTNAKTDSGTIGVHREVSENSSGNLSENWIGKWVEADGSIRRRGFSVHKYGEDDAKDMAIRARQEAIARVDNDARRQIRDLVLTSPSDRGARSRRKRD